jgi:AcrR family transcriptional regulator
MGRKQQGESTRHLILNHAMKLASSIGFENLSIGHLAEELKLSKSGLFAHFRSKEALQIQVLETAAAAFSQEVVRPAVKAPRGLPRLQALFDRWMEWGKNRFEGGGCVFITASIEWDDRNGPVRECVLRLQKEWITVMRTVAQTAIDQGEFRKDTDTAAFAQDLYGIILSFHYFARLIQDPQAEQRARASLERLIASAKV